LPLDCIFIAGQTADVGEVDLSVATDLLPSGQGYFCADFSVNRLLFIIGWVAAVWRHVFAAI
jgi:hypothetical protein